MNSLLEKFLMIAAPVAIVSVCYAAYVSIQSAAVSENNRAWEKSIHQMESRLETRLDSIRADSQSTASEVVRSVEGQSETVNKSIASILRKPPSEKLVIVNEKGDCQFTPDYSKAILEIRSSLP